MRNTNPGESMDGPGAGSDVRVRLLAERDRLTSRRDGVRAGLPGETESGRAI